MRFQSNVNIWLLFVATICVDATLLVLATSRSESSEVGIYMAIALNALALGQLGVVCVWSSFTSFRSVWTRLSPLLFAILAAFIVTIALSEPSTFFSSYVSSLTFFCLYAALLLAAIWLLKRTSFWRRRTGIAMTWQFSLANLLIGTTVVAVLSAMLRSSPLFGETANFLFIFCSIALSILTVVLWSLAWHGLLRLAAVFASAMFLAVLGLVVMQLDEPGVYSPVLLVIYGAHFLLQAIMLVLWLGIGGLIPRAPSADE
jgi:hypothetical protein